MLPSWLRHVFRDRISAATEAPLRGLYLIDLDVDPSAQEIANQRWHAAWTARPAVAGRVVGMDEDGDHYCLTCGHYPAYNTCSDPCCQDVS